MHAHLHMSKKSSTFAAENCVKAIIDKQLIYEKVFLCSTHVHGKHGIF